MGMRCGCERCRPGSRVTHCERFPREAVGRRVGNGAVETSAGSLRRTRGWTRAQGEGEAGAEAGQVLFQRRDEEEEEMQKLRLFSAEFSGQWPRAENPPHPALHPWPGASLGETSHRSCTFAARPCAQ